MKTLQSILKTISDKEEISDRGKKRCAFCNAVEGEKNEKSFRSIKLKEVKIMDSNIFACQTCRKKHKPLFRISINTSKEKQSIFSKVLSFCFNFCVVFLFTSSLIFAQPGLPSTPSQAPIDGGLGLLAALGGTYAIKKLKSKKENRKVR